MGGFYCISTINTFSLTHSHTPTDTLTHEAEAPPLPVAAPRDNQIPRQPARNLVSLLAGLLSRRRRGWFPWLLHMMPKAKRTEAVDHGDEEFMLSQDQMDAEEAAAEEAEVESRCSCTAAKQ